MSAAAFWTCCRRALRLGRPVAGGRRFEDPARPAPPLAARPGRPSPERDGAWVTLLVSECGATVAIGPFTFGFALRLASAIAAGRPRARVRFSVSAVGPAGVSP